MKLAQYRSDFYIGAALLIILVLVPMSTMAGIPYLPGTLFAFAGLMPIIEILTKKPITMNKTEEQISTWNQSIMSCISEGVHQMSILKFRGQLTQEELLKHERGSIFGAGVIPNGEQGIYMVAGAENEGKALVWVAKKGGGHNDWAIYCHWAQKGIIEAAIHGQKVMLASSIKKLVNATDQALQTYRY